MINKDSIIVVTGAAGFIGSCMVSLLNQHEFENIILVDEFGDEEKELNLFGKKYSKKIEREFFFDWIEKEKPAIEFIFHLGARTDTTEFDYSIHQHLNVDYSQKIWRYCTENKVQLVYASSAATYGAGEFGYNDDHALIEKLQPLNPYGVSKNEFDKWSIEEANNKNNYPPLWAGLKFFNVYGPNEYHKARMASVIFHSYNQIKQNAIVKLFKSHKEGFKDGEQLRDFIYVKDVIKVCLWFMDLFTSDRPTVDSGIYNLGTGKARSFNALVTATFAGLNKEASINYIEMPQDLRETYQYYTQANMEKLKNAGYTAPFYTLEEGVDDYVRNYLTESKYF